MSAEGGFPGESLDADCLDTSYGIIPLVITIFQVMMTTKSRIMLINRDGSADAGRLTLAKAMAILSSVLSFAFAISSMTLTHGDCVGTMYNIAAIAHLVTCVTGLLVTVTLFHYCDLREVVFIVSAAAALDTIYVFLQIFATAYDAYHAPRITHPLAPAVDQHFALATYICSALVCLACWSVFIHMVEASSVSSSGWAMTMVTLNIFIYVGIMVINAQYTTDFDLQGSDLVWGSYKHKLPALATTSNLAVAFVNAFSTYSS